MCVRERERERERERTCAHELQSARKSERERERMYARVRAQYLCVHESGIV